MTAHRLPFLVMTGSGEGSETRQAVTMDLVDRDLSVPSLGPVVVSTNSASLARRLAGYPIHVELGPPEKPFHFGRRLAGLIAGYGMWCQAYMGRGAGLCQESAEMEALSLVEG
jgi:hypothetical protein